MHKLRDGTWKVDLSWVKDFQDLTILEGKPVSDLDLTGTRVSDLRPLRGMPLKVLRLRECTQLSDLSPVAEFGELNTLTLSPNVGGFALLRRLPKLKNLSFIPGDKLSASKESDGTWTVDLSGLKKFQDLAIFEGIPIRTLCLQETSVSDLGPIRGMPLEILILVETKVTDLSPLAGMPLRQLKLYKEPVTNLEPLRGLPIEVLHLGETQISDLSPLSGMPLQSLHLQGTAVTDLSPLSGMPLQSLHLQGTAVTDLEPLSGMPLTDLDMRECNQITDLSPLAKSTELESIGLPPTPGEIAFLVELPKLLYINDAHSVGFWTSHSNALRTAGREIEALKLQEKILEFRRKMSGPSHPLTLWAIHWLVYHNSDSLSEVRLQELGQEVLAAFEKIIARPVDELGQNEHFKSLRWCLERLAIIHHDAGRHGKGTEFRKALVEFVRKAFGLDHPETLKAMTNLARSYESEGREKEAKELRSKIAALKNKETESQK